MSSFSKLESESPPNGDFDKKQTKGQIAIPVALTSDPLYNKLINHFQNAEFGKCKEVLENLEQMYPGHPLLLKFKDDLQLKLSLQNMAVRGVKKAKLSKFKVTFKMGLFAVVATIVVMAVFLISYPFFNDINIARRLEIQATQLDSLKGQAEELLIAGKPQDASNIVEKIRSLDPEYVHLPELTTQTIDLLLLETKYNVALDLVQQNRLVEAMLYFREIETARPGLWDINQQIDLIASPDRIANFMAEGDAAYKVEMWDQVINAYETVLILDPNLNDTKMNEQLAESYLRKIPGMLQSENSTKEEVEKAYEYYLKANTLTPETEALDSGVRELHDNISNLLSQKFTHLSKANLANTEQTSTTIDEAIGFQKKAVDINPSDPSLKVDLKNAEHYQSAFENLIGLQWELALADLELIYSSDPDFANGNVRSMLYETYFSLGKQFHSQGQYSNALNVLKQAEILSLDFTDNLMKQFQVQVLLGDTVEKLGNFQEAVAYYQNALNGIQGSERLANYPEFVAILNEANRFSEEGDYGRAFVSYQDLLKEIDVIYLKSEIEIKDEGFLVFFANENFSSVDAILDANQLPNAMVVTFARKLIVPVIDK